MKFQRKISPETRKILLAQLKEFEREVRMTKAERAALHDWVSAGHSPYDNEQNLYFDTSPLDFVSALRFTQRLKKCCQSSRRSPAMRNLKKFPISTILSLMLSQLTSRLVFHCRKRMRRLKETKRLPPKTSIYRFDDSFS